jgi:hypothetical protein
LLTRLFYCSHHKKAYERLDPQLALPSHRIPAVFALLLLSLIDPTKIAQSS